MSHLHLIIKKNRIVINVSEVRVNTCNGKALSHMSTCTRFCFGLYRDLCEKK